MQPDATELDAHITIGIFGPDDNKRCYCEPVIQKQSNSTLNSNADAEPNEAGGQDDNGCHNSNCERTAIVVHVFGRVLRGGRHGECLEELDSPKREDLILRASKIVRRGKWDMGEMRRLKGFFFGLHRQLAVGAGLGTANSQQRNTEGGPDESFRILTTCLVSRYST